MPKLKNPPQGGEKYLCLTLFATMAASVVSAVICIYCIVIIYKPSKEVLDSKIVPSPIRCTTLSNIRNLTGPENCGVVGVSDWSSCEEWCLSKSNKECSHVKASARHEGTKIYWSGCDFSKDRDGNYNNFVNHTCNIMEDIEEWNCKMFDSEAKEGQVGHKQICKDFDNIIVSCEAGICKNVSSVYDCTFRDRLTDIKEDWSETVGKGFCHCENCKDESVAYHGVCNELVSGCNKKHDGDNKWKNMDNQTEKAICVNVNQCATCRSICSQRGECFNMNARRDPTEIGTDEFGNSVLTYYTCKNGTCVEIYDLKCQRRCNEFEFDMRDKNSVIISEERIIIAKCSSRSSPEQSRITNDKNRRRNTLFVACSNVTFDIDGEIITDDCVNGTWMDSNFNGGKTNYSFLMDQYSELRDDPGYQARDIKNEQEITIYNNTKLKINIEGCSNELKERCKEFYKKYGRDGRNYTARAIYPCYYNPEDPDFVVINFDQESTLEILILFSAIPGGILILSCCYMCGCSKFVQVTDDGHMRLKCCGKYVTGIGNVPIMDPPRKKRFHPIENGD